jgi:hypothetical protein
MSSTIRIRGGVGPQEAAAIMAAIQQLIDEEAASQAMTAPRNLPTAWVRSSQRRVVKPARQVTTSLSSHGIADGQIS